MERILCHFHPQAGNAAWKMVWGSGPAADWLDQLALRLHSYLLGISQRLWNVQISLPTHPNSSVFLQDQPVHLFMPQFLHWDKLPPLKQLCIKIKEVAIITHNPFPAAMKGDG